MHYEVLSLLNEMFQVFLIAPMFEEKIRIRDNKGRLSPPFRDRRPVTTWTDRVAHFPSMNLKLFTWKRSTRRSWKHLTSRKCPLEAMSMRKQKGL